MGLLRKVLGRITPHLEPDLLLSEVLSEAASAAGSMSPDERRGARMALLAVLDCLGAKGLLSRGEAAELRKRTEAAF